MQHPDPVDEVFPEPTTNERDALAWSPGPAPAGLELLKLWVHQYEAGQRPIPTNGCFPGVDPRDLAGVIGVWESERAAAEHTRAQMESARRRCDEVQREQGVTRSENARLRTAVGQMEEQATAAQSRCDTAQDRVKNLEGHVKALRTQRDRMAHRLSVASAHTEIIREARGPEHTITKADVEEIAAAVVATKGNPVDGERLVVLSSGSVDKIAQQVAIRLVERVATPSFRAAVSALQAGAAGASSIMRSVGEEERCQHLSWENGGAGFRRCVDCGATSESGRPWS